MNIQSRLSTLTIEEKIGQLLQLAPFFFIKDLKVEVAGALRTLDLSEADIFLAGSVLGIHDAKEMIAIQKTYLQKSRHKIPLMFMADVIHGYETIFPIPIALASSFNPDLAKRAARIAALEAQTAGIHVTFAPMVDVSRDPRWGRVMEGFGEDAYLASCFSRASVEGFQHDGIDKEGNLAACVKHFAAYGAPEAGRDYNTVDMSMYTFYNHYAPPYQAGIKAGAHLIMTAFNTFNGIPATVHRGLLRDILRKEMGFEGVVITDYDALQQVIAHGVAADRKEAARLAIEAGVDIEMASTAYVRYLKTLIDEGDIPLSMLDEAVLRVLALKEKLGLFDNPFKGADPLKAQQRVRHPDHLAESESLARECLVLLKNDHQVLPLDKTRSIALIGPYVDEPSTNGNWSWHGDIRLNETLHHAFARKGHDVVMAKPGDQATDYDRQDIDMLKKADVIIICAGEQARHSGEARSRTKLGLPDGQETLIKLAKATGRPVVVLLFSGRPLVLNDILEADAVMLCWFLGSRAASAIVDLVNGTFNPSGRLPMTFPQHEGQIPIYYNHLNTGRPYLDERNEYVSKYLDVSNHPQFAFGFGLSYARFIYADMRLNQEVMNMDDTLTITVNVTNDSQREGHEVIQLYIRDLVSLPVRPVKELKKFQKVWFGPAETKPIAFHLKVADLAAFDQTGKPHIEPGAFDVFVGGDSNTTLSKRFVLKDASTILAASILK